jgi:hypothetical protein
MVGYGRVCFDLARYGRQGKARCGKFSRVVLRQAGCVLSGCDKARLISTSDRQGGFSCG